MTHHAQDAIKLFVGNLPQSSTEEQLLPFFETIGKVGGWRGGRADGHVQGHACGWACERRRLSSGGAAWRCTPSRAVCLGWLRPQQGWPAPRSCQASTRAPHTLLQVIELVVVRDKASHKSKGSAFLWYEQRLHAERAILQVRAWAVRVVCTLCVSAACTCCVADRCSAFGCHALRPTWPPTHSPTTLDSTLLTRLPSSLTCAP